MKTLQAGSNPSETIQNLFKLKDGRADPSLKSVSKTLELLGNPEEDLEVVLVGGTNGKGSVTDFTSAMLEEKGFKTGKFKSPHLVDVTERIEINNSRISRKELAEILEEIAETGVELSFFETLTVAAYRYFQQENVDFAVMEVGMGGRLDATNAADPAASVITNVGMDHSEYLGSSKNRIAEEIAGITPTNGSLITPTDNSQVLKNAKERGSVVKKPNRLKKVETGKFSYKDKKVDLGFGGSLQKVNLEAAITLVEELAGEPKSFPKVEKLKLPGRCDKIRENPLYLQDGAHNPHAVEKLKKILPDQNSVIFGATKTKDVKQMIELLESKTSKFYFTKPDLEWAMDPQKLTSKTSKQCEIVKSPVKAESKALTDDNPVLATGSLYMIGNLKERGVAEWRR